MIAIAEANVVVGVSSNCDAFTDVLNSVACGAIERTRLAKVFWWMLHVSIALVCWSNRRQSIILGFKPLL
jgi:hypothetical protein